MADISKIRVNNTTYDIKDSNAAKIYFGYIGDRRNTFYADAEHTIEIPLEDDTLYIDMTDPTVSGFVLYGRNTAGAIGNMSLIAIGRPYSEGDSWGVVPGDKGYRAYYHATDSSRVSTPQPSGFYKIAATSEGHIASLTSVTKTDITDLGIPAQDTTYESKSAVSGGTAVSLVTTGEKYTWNNKANSSAIPSASSASPKMNGSATSGSSSYWSRGDHVHPTDTSRQAAATTKYVMTSIGSSYTLVDALTQTISPGQVCRFTAMSMYNGSAPTGVIISRSNDASLFNNQGQLIAKNEEAGHVALTASGLWGNYGSSSQNIYVWIKNASTGSNRTFLIKDILGTF